MPAVGIAKNEQKQDADEDQDVDYVGDDFDESPRQKKLENQGLTKDDKKLGQKDDDDEDNYDEDEDDANEDEVIDVAERIFIRIAEQIISREIKTVREVFADHIVEMEFDGQIIELLEPEGLINGMKGLGIDDLTDQDQKYLLRVLTKPELEGAIVLDELLQIMENLGLNDDADDYDMDRDGRDPESPE